MTKLTFLTVMPSPYQRQLFKRIAQSGQVDLAVVYYTYGAKDREWQRPKLEAFESVLPGSTITPMGNSAHLNLSIRQWIKNRASDLTVVSDYSAPTAQLAMRTLAKRDEPFMFWGEAPGFQARGAIGSWVRKQLQSPLKNTAAIAGIGSRAADIYRDLFPGKRIYNIPYFCDLAPYAEAASSATPKQGNSVNVLFSGQLIERKGVDVLLSAFLIAREKQPNLTLTILGGGPLRSELESRIPAHLTDSVEFLGHVEPNEIPPIFANCDVFCLPSLYDGWGVVVNEALGAGVPIIVSDAVGAGHDIVGDGVNGLVVKAGDERSLADALLDIADTTRRDRMACAAEAARENWTLDRGAELWLNAASDVLGRELVQ